MPRARIDEGRIHDRRNQASEDQQANKDLAATSAALSESEQDNALAAVRAAVREIVPGSRGAAIATELALL